MSRTMQRLLLLIQFLPLTVFVGCARGKGFTDEAWAVAFLMGGIAAVVETVLLVALRRVTLNRLILGANLFLMVGAIGFGIGVMPIMEIYGLMRESALLASVLVVGIVTTFATEVGFIEVEGQDRRETVVHSIYLILVTLAVLAVSFTFRGNTLWAGIIPFLIVVFARGALQRKLKF